MKITIENNYTKAFTVFIENASREDVQAIRKVTDERQQITLPAYFDEISHAEPRAWSKDHQQAFVTTARMHFAACQNKILTIKHLRSLSEPCLTLKDAKDLADFAIGSIQTLPWLKA